MGDHPKRSNILLVGVVMKNKVEIVWSNPGSTKKQSEPKREKAMKSQINRISVGHNSAEIFLRFGDKTVILPPAAGKKLNIDLARAVSNWEKEHGTIRDDKSKRKKKETVPKKVLKELYKSRKVGSKLISINTGKRKHLPLKDE